MINDRFKDVRQKLGYTQQELAKKLDTSSGHISDIENGRKTPGGEFLKRLFDSYHVNINWILSGHGEMFIGGSLSGTIREVVAVPSEGFVNIPLYHINGSAGLGTPAPDTEEQELIAINEAWVRRVLCVSPASLSVITVSGDSMEPTLRNGDLIIVDMSQNQPANEGVYVVRLDNELLVKRVQLRGAAATLYSDNGLYRDITIDLSNTSDFAIVGRVVGYVRKMV